MSTVADHRFATSKFAGFGQDVRFTPVPNPLLSGILESMNSLDELKVVLRAIWISHSKGLWQAVTKAELCSDKTVAKMLNASGKELEERVQRALDDAQSKAIFITYGTGADQAYLLNTYYNRQQLMRTNTPSQEPGNEHDVLPTIESADLIPAERNAFTAYEENIGPLTPMIADALRDMLTRHSDYEIVKAINDAVLANARNWRYISAILRNREGLNEVGKSKRLSKKEDPDSFIREYRQRQSARGNH